MLSAGIGEFFIRTNNLYWNFTLGAAFNHEKYRVSDMPNQTSQESFLSREFNAFDAGDLYLSTGISTYPSLSEKGRYRANFQFDIKYDLPLDFYIGIGATYNYENQPADGTSDSDYVLQTTIGWKS